MGDFMAKVMEMARHPRRVLEQIRRFATEDMGKVVYQANLNQTMKGQAVYMAEIWECLEHGDIMEEYIYFEETGTYAKLVCHTSDGTIYVDVHMLKPEGQLRVLFATKEED